MAFATAKDGIRLYYEEAGRGTPIIFVHEFGGNYRSWELQIRFFSRRHRCITFAARGYPPSDVPDDLEAYSQQNAASDILAVLDALDDREGACRRALDGRFCHAAFRPELSGPRIVADRCRRRLRRREGIPGIFPRRIAGGREAVRDAGRQGALPRPTRWVPSRVQFQNKDPRGWREFADQLGQHSSKGAAMTMRGVQARRPSLYDLEDRLSRMPVPTLIVSGDEDDHCLQPGIYLKRTIPAAGLAVLPKTGHTLNLEEPALFNQVLAEFIATSKPDAGSRAIRAPCRRRS